METQRTSKPNAMHALEFDQPIDRWDEALPIGNGLTGCLIWGSGNPLRFSLDRGDLWDTTPTWQSLSEDYNYRHLIELVREQNNDEIHRLFDACYSFTTPTKLPAGRLELQFGGVPNRVVSRLSVREAMAEVELLVGGKRAHVKTFLHATERVGWISVDSQDLDAELNILPPAYHNREWVDVSHSPNSNELSALGYPLAETGSDGSLEWFVQKTNGTLEYAVIVGANRVDEQRMEYVYIVASSHDGDDWLDNAKRQVEGAITQGFEQSVFAHLAWWDRFWAKSAVSLPEPDIERQWYLTNYFLGSCSRKGSPPMPLQGVWTADEGFLPPWKGDYHNDLNTQMSYWHYMKANHLEEGESFIDFLWGLVPQARRFARQFFDAPGICLPSVMSIDGQSLGGWPMYSINLVNQIWLCQAFDHYWQYSGDELFLRVKAYPYFQETAQCVMRWLQPGDDGKLVLPLSSSPEIHGNLPESWLTPNSNNDLALLLYLFETLSDMAEILGHESERLEWREVLGQLPELAVNDQHVLMLSPDETLQESHRHLSHMMAVYPLHLMDYHHSERHRQIIDASVAQLEQLGRMYWVGFSFAWMANLYAIQGNGEAALQELQLFLGSLCSANGFHLNGDYKQTGVTEMHYRPFTLESNMGWADALQEMLLQNRKGMIRVFPAIPETWKREGASFESFRAGGGVLVSAAIKDGRLQKVRIYAEKDASITLHNDFGASPIRICLDGEANVQSFGTTIPLSLRRGQSCILSQQ